MIRIFRIEQIPDTDRLFYRIHDHTLKKGGQVHSGCFTQQGKGKSRSMSTDWNKYSSATKSRSRAREPSKNSIASFVKGEVAQIDGIGVSHDPIWCNRAHTSVRWHDDRENNFQIRARLSTLYRIECKSSAILLTDRKQMGGRHEST